MVFYSRVLARGCYDLSQHEIDKRFKNHQCLGSFFSAFCFWFNRLAQAVLWSTNGANDEPTVFTTRLNAGILNVVEMYVCLILHDFKPDKRICRCSRYPKYFPDCLQTAQQPLNVSIDCLPRRERFGCRNRHAVDRALRHIRLEAACRTYNNFSSLNYLEDEIQISYQKAARKNVKIDTSMEYFFAMYNRSWQKIAQLRLLQIPDNPLTKEFRDALESCGVYDVSFRLPESWWRYEELRRVRHSWDEYLRCDLDWDRDSTYCLKWMFM